jgi:hypothetical protein
MRQTYDKAVWILRFGSHLTENTMRLCYKDRLVKAVHVFSHPALAVNAVTNVTALVNPLKH